MGKIDETNYGEYAKMKELEKKLSAPNCEDFISRLIYYINEKGMSHPLGTLVLPYWVWATAMSSPMNSCWPSSA